MCLDLWIGQADGDKGTHLPGLWTLSSYSATYLTLCRVTLLESMLFPIPLLPLP